MKKHVAWILLLLFAAGFSGPALAVQVPMEQIVFYVH